MSIATFAGETPAQIAKHREIERRHRRSRRYDTGPLIARLRAVELERIFVHTYGARSLPDDDAGRADLRLMADHLAQIDPRRIRIWAADWLPEIEGAELDALIASAGVGRRWKADPLALALGLDDATRTRLKIRTIGAVDCTKTQRKACRRRKRILAARARRAAAGAKPRAQAAESLMPWVAEGISRRTWYRRRAKVGTDGTDTRPVPLSSPESKRCHEAASDSAEAADKRPGVGEAHSGETNSPIAKPLPSLHKGRSHDETGLGDVAGLDPGDMLIDDAPDCSLGAGIGPFAFCFYHRLYFRLLGEPWSRELEAELSELNDVIEAERELRALMKLCRALQVAQRDDPSAHRHTRRGRG
ncbi:hypothetical protein [Bradyrhizobium japonicum]|uniref:hypothetical protein n=1 Tax=Bradyrhizobium japonicum TaxID=375 RepID=UPI00126A20A2|nr:hypothetical protein [Bradyrhizobium japonicum]